MKNDEPYLLLNDRLPLPRELKRTKRVPSYKCGHCPSIVVLNPIRRRERAYCKRCELPLCDECDVRRHASGAEDCRGLKELLDRGRARALEVQERAARLSRPIVFSPLSWVPR